MAGNSCGSCKWLAVPADHLIKSGLRVNRKHAYRMYACRVPVDPRLIAFPARFDVEVRDRLYMCPEYGADCAFHEARTSP